MTETGSVQGGGPLTVIATWADIQSCWLEIDLNGECGTICPASAGRTSVGSNLSGLLDWLRDYTE